MKRIVLKSSSPRRKELMEKLGYKFDIKVYPVDETMDDNKTPFENVKELSYLKASVKMEEDYGSILIGCDTIVVLDDVIYGTRSEKFHAIVSEIYRYHRTGQPLLVGTISIETSEYLSSLLTRHGIPHQVLNAKHHEKEAHIIACAGQLGKVTIATNMAGRGTDIVLGKFTKQELLDHWKRYNLAPKNAFLNNKDLDEKLTRHWGKVYLNITDETVPVETLKAQLNAYWKEHEMTPLKLCEDVASLGGLYDEADL